MPPTSHHPPWKTLLAFFIIYFVWGSTFFAIRVGVHEVPPLLLAAMRFTVAGGVLSLWLIAKREPLPTRRQWLSVLLLALMIFVFDYGLLFWAEQRVPSGIAAVMLATIPVFMALSEIAFLRTQHLTVRLSIALLIGIAGVAVLMSHSLNLAGTPIDTTGAVALIFAAMSWAIASILTRRLPLPPSKVMSSGTQMLAGGLMLFIAAAAAGEFRNFHPAAVSSRRMVLPHLPHRRRLHHRIHGLPLAPPPRIAHQGRHLRLRQSRRSCPRGILPRRRNPRPAHHPRHPLRSRQCRGHHHHPRQTTSRPTRFESLQIAPMLHSQINQPKAQSIKIFASMKCPYCGFGQDRVVDSRESKEADSIRRRRECESCNRRFTTYERIDEIPYMVVKKDGRRERFDRQKVLSGLLRACEKRPVPSSKLEAIVDATESFLMDAPERERTTSEVGELIMKHLKGLDTVAYIRFASVYRDFKDVREFKEELEGLLDSHRTPKGKK